VDYQQKDMTNSTTTITEEDDDSSNVESVPIFVPSMEYISQIPANLHPTLFPTEKDQREFLSQYELNGEDGFDMFDDNVKDLITRLMSSTARSAFLANSLADIHRRIASGQTASGQTIAGGDWLDESDDDDETDVDPRDTEDEDLQIDSPDISSNVDTDEEAPADNEGRNSVVGVIPPAPPPPSFSLVPPTASLTVRPTYDQAYDDLEEEEDEPREVESPESSMAVTRFLIKHLPKQLSRLRNEKAELEEKIHDLEATVSEQRGKMGEHERRVEAERSKLRKLEELLEKKCNAPTEEFPYETQVSFEHHNETLVWYIRDPSQENTYSLSFTAEESTTELSPISISTSSDSDRNGTNSSSPVTVLHYKCQSPGLYTLHINQPAHRNQNLSFSYKHESKPNL